MAQFRVQSRVGSNQLVHNHVSQGLSFSLTILHMWQGPQLSKKLCIFWVLKTSYPQENRSSTTKCCIWAVYWMHIFLDRLDRPRKINQHYCFTAQGPVVDNRVVMSEDSSLGWIWCRDKGPQANSGKQHTKAGDCLPMWAKQGLLWK